MKIRLKQLMAGPGGVRPAGAELSAPGDITEAEARALLDGRYAEPVVDTTPKPPVVPAPPTSEAGTDAPAEPEPPAPPAFRRRR